MSTPRVATWRALVRGFVPCGKGIAPRISRSPYLWCMDPATQAMLWSRSAITDSSAELYTLMAVTPQGALLVMREAHEYDSKRFDPLYAALLTADNGDGLQIVGNVGAYTNHPGDLVTRLIGEIEARKEANNWVTNSQYLLELWDPLSGETIESRDLTPDEVSFPWFPGYTMGAAGFTVATWGVADSVTYQLCDGHTGAILFDSFGDPVEFSLTHPPDGPWLTDFIDITPGADGFFRVLGDGVGMGFSGYHAAAPDGINVDSVLYAMGFTETATLTAAPKTRVPYPLAPEPALNFDDIHMEPAYFYVLDSTIIKPTQGAPYNLTADTDASLPLANQPTIYHVRAIHNVTLKEAWVRELPLVVNVLGNTSALFAGMVGTNLTVLVQPGPTLTVRYEIDLARGIIVGTTDLHTAVDLKDEATMVCASSDFFVASATGVQIYEDVFSIGPT